MLDEKSLYASHLFYCNKLRTAHVTLRSSSLFQSRDSLAAEHRNVIPIRPRRWTRRPDPFKGILIAAAAIWDAIGPMQRPFAGHGEGPPLENPIVGRACRRGAPHCTKRGDAIGHVKQGCCQRPPSPPLPPPTSPPSPVLPSRGAARSVTNGRCEPADGLPFVLLPFSCLPPLARLIVRPMRSSPFDTRVY